MLLSARSEIETVMAAITSCEHTDEYDIYHVGLSISRDSVHRVFSNGVLFDKDLHGGLYEENQVTIGKNCPGAYLSPAWGPDKVQVMPDFGCQGMSAQYVCFKPKVEAKSDAISVGASSKLSSFGGAFQIALVCLVCFMFCFICFLLMEVNKLKSSKSQQTTDLA